MNASRVYLHGLLDRVADKDLGSVQRMLQAMVIDEGELSRLAVPLDDEPETEDERRAVEEALRDPRVVPHDEILREYGLK